MHIQEKRLSLIRATFPLAVGLLAGLPLICAPKAEPGKVHFVLRMDRSHDPFVSSGKPSEEQWIREHWWRMMVYTTYFDEKTSWYPGALLYKDSYGVVPDQKEVLIQHSDWLLKDSSGNKLFIPYDCKPAENRCPYYAADIGNPAFRQWWIDEARKVLARGYKGLWIDDVNMSWRVGNGRGDSVNPIDTRTGKLMSEQDWRRYMAEFMERIRAELTSIEIVQNDIWFAGPEGVRDRDPFIKRQSAAADYINNENGVYGDNGLRGGDGEWSFDAKLQYYDRMHALGTGVIIDEVAPESDTPKGRQFTLASYFLISTGRDAVGNQHIRNSAGWWHGYDTDLGAPLGARTIWKKLYRRDFTEGLALVNPPEAAAATVELPAEFVTLEGLKVKSVTLGPKEGIVLQRPH